MGGDSASGTIGAYQPGGVAAANALVFWPLADATATVRSRSAPPVVFFWPPLGLVDRLRRLSWALDSASAPAAPWLAGPGSRLRGRGPSPQARGRLPAETPRDRFNDVSFTYRAASAPVLDGLDLDDRAGTSLAIVGQNGAGKTTLAKLLCRFYDPDSGRSRSTDATCAPRRR